MGIEGDPEEMSDLELLQSGEIEVTHRLVDASNATLFGRIEGFGEVIYKPIAGERPLWDFPDGTLADREVAAYKVSEILGLNVVPMTVLREGPFGPGMVQRWVSIDPDADIIAFGQGGDAQLRLMTLFDAVINNTDRKFGHLLLDLHGRLFGCDHGVTFHVEDKLRTVLWQFAGDPMNENEMRTLTRTFENEDQIRSDLSSHLHEDEIEAFFERSRKLAESGLFPTPHDEWPSVPWPPV